MAIEQERKICAIEVAHAEQENAIRVACLAQSRPCDVLVQLESLGLIGFAHALHDEAARLHHPKSRQPVQRGEGLLSNHAVERRLFSVRALTHVRRQIMGQDLAEDAGGLKAPIVKRQAVKVSDGARIGIEAVVLLELLCELARSEAIARR